MTETNFYEIKDYDINFSINDSTLTIRLHPDIDVMSVRKQIIQHQEDAKNYEIIRKYVVGVLSMKQIKELSLLLDPIARRILINLYMDCPQMPEESEFKTNFKKDDE